MPVGVGSGNLVKMHALTLRHNDDDDDDNNHALSYKFKISFRSLHQLITQ